MTLQEWLSERGLTDYPEDKQEDILDYFGNFLETDVEHECVIEPNSYSFCRLDSGEIVMWYGLESKLWESDLELAESDPQGYRDILNKLGSRQILCLYCSNEIEREVEAPALDDDDGWAALAEAHDDDCEWILTRGHRQSADPLDEFLDGFADGADVPRRGETGADEMWAAYSTQLSDGERIEIESGRYTSGVTEGKRYAEWCQNQEQAG